jgi:hypothetical protein
MGKDSVNKNYTTVWTILVTRVLMYFSQTFRDLMTTYPDVVYAIDGIVLAVLRKLTTGFK